MTLNAFHLQPHCVELLTDTSSYVRPDGRLKSDCTKVHAFAHSSSVVMGGGASLLLGDFFRWASHVEARDVHELAASAEFILPTLWERVLEVGPSQGSTVVFLFGWSEAEGRYVGYGLTAGDDLPKYLRWTAIDVRSHNHDHSLPLPASKFFVSPDPDLRHGAQAPPTSLAGWVELADTVRRTQAAQPVDVRCPIAGDVVYTAMTDRRMVTQSTIHTFDDSIDWAAP